MRTQFCHVRLLPYRTVNEAVKKRERLCTAGGNVNWYTTMENNTKNPQKIEFRTTIWSTNPLLGIYLKEWNLCLKEISVPPCFSIIYNSQDMSIYEYYGILCSLKKKEILQFNKMNGPWVIVLSEISQRMLYDLNYMWKLIKLNL